MTLKVIMLDDSEDRLNVFKKAFVKQGVYLTRDVESMKALLSTNTFALISLDNDLGVGMKEGKDIAEYLYKHPENPNHSAKIIIHSWNTVAANIMKNYLPRAIYIPFDPKMYERIYGKN